MWSKIKIVIGIFSLIVAVVNIYLYYTLSKESKIQWDEINLGNIIIIKGIERIWERIYLKDYNSIPLTEYKVLGYVKQNEGTGKLLDSIVNIEERLVLLDSTLTQIPNTYGYFSLKEVNEEIDRLSLASNKYKIYKEREFRFIVRNKGNTPARNITFETYVSIDGDKEQLIKYENTPIELEGNLESTIPVSILYSSKIPAPNIIKIRIIIKWINIYDEEKSRVVYLSWPKPFYEEDLNIKNY